MSDEQEQQLEITEHDLAVLAYLADIGKTILQSQVHGNGLSDERQALARRMLDDGEKILSRLRRYATKRSAQMKNQAGESDSVP